jgi:hypothetical protein
MTRLSTSTLELITRGLQEVLGGDILKAVLAEGRTPKGYWGAYMILLDLVQKLRIFSRNRSHR